MNLGECRLLLSVAVTTTRIASPLPTPLGRTADAELGMARAYLSDGAGFESRGDPVNALASFFYAFGWVHFGWNYGTLVPETERGNACPFQAPFERFPPPALDKLGEKTTRYERLLATARSAVSCAPDPAAPAHAMAAKVLQIAEVYQVQGRWLLRGMRQEDALAAFSYGHGWLDAGARAGLFIIERDRDLFTV
jgi:hypothetical protein